MSRLLVLAILLLPCLAQAKAWMGITPAESSREDVFKRFGEPTKKVAQADGKEILAYVGEHAIKGTAQAQFIIASGKVEQIVVFPASTLDITEIEDSFGRSCATEKPGSGAPCYHKQLTDDFRTYFWYKRSGLVVFFNEDKKTVQSLIYNAPASATASK